MQGTILQAGMKRRPGHLEGGLPSLEGSDTTAASTTTRGAATATPTSTSTVATTASTTSATVEAATSASTEASTTVTTETTTATSTAVVVSGLRVVETDATAVKVSTALGLEGLLGTIDIFELDVAEALGPARLTVGGESDALDTVVVEQRPDSVLGGVEGKVTDKQGGAGGASHIAESLCALFTSIAGVAGKADIDLDGTAVDFLAVKLEGLGDSPSGGEVDVSESTRFAGVAVHLDGGGLDLTTLGELLGEPVVVDVP